VNHPYSFALAAVFSVFLAETAFPQANPAPRTQTASQPVKNPSRTDKLIVYELTTRLFGNTNTTNREWGALAENGTGTFNDINDAALKSLKAFGVTHLWCMGVIEHATMEDFTAQGLPKDHPAVIKGRAGSPYAIKDYYDVNPFLASSPDKRMAEFEALVARTHKNGLQFLIDFVPNHVARQYRSDARPAGVRDFGEDDRTDVAFDPNNNFYYLPGQPFEVPEGVRTPVPADGPYREVPAKATGNDVFKPRPSIDDWYETIKLNYGVDYQNSRKTHFEPTPGTWLKMRDILVYWARKGVDGFRCDMAEMVPVQFWGWVIPEVRRAVGREVLFIAEIYNPKEYHRYIREGKFDYLYDKVGLYDALRRLMEGRGNVADITKVWQEESGDIDQHMLRFLENHDEQRIASDFFARDARFGLPAMTVSATMGRGPLMYYFGQETGEPGRDKEGFQGADGRTTIFDWWGVPTWQGYLNGGRFDGAKLTPEQQTLRRQYQSLNSLCLQSDAVRSGGFYDLQYANTGGQATGYADDKIYSYLRHSGKQRLLVVANFDRDRAHETGVRIPAEAWQAMGLDPAGTYQFKDIFLNQELKISAKGTDPVPLRLAANSVLVLDVTKKR
jgi:glycosidase